MKKKRQQGQSEIKQLNPNWEQLRQKLKSSGPRRQPSKTPQEESEAGNESSILGKRKDRDLIEESNVSRPNPLIPTSSDSSITEALAMDCEMVGVSSLGNKSALGRVTLVNKWGNVVYDEFVRPVEWIVDFRTEISGIRARDLKKAKNFMVVQKEVAELLKGRILVGHALQNDLKALLLTHPKKDIRDTSHYQPFLKDGRSRALRHLASEFLGVEIQNGEHCPIEDARAAMLLYQKKRKIWEKSVKDMTRLKEKKKQRKPKSKRKKESSDVHHDDAS
ncbi:OLC1v1001786C1 [Oldenlandia corymbosa var. corymbosa]|uniref:RNA exonuclease 4 n=1 Tax=Oldenlandia corymbosa var. corymbosa TaxID=529605 RepID=A0AAV1D6S4_OLDCO|nr:OLC1v1001786C1 [Oldenlandia corymbosa var. corymbosa]